jgi:cyclohexanone monooxygenase
MNFLNCIDPKGHADVDLVDDGWTEVYRRLMFNPLREQPSGMPLAEATERADYEWMEKIRARVDGIVTDKATAEALMPWYAYFCKRPGFHDEYLATFNLPSVTLVDTQGVGIERVYEGGVIANGRKYPLDVLIFATGFEAGETTAPKFGCTVTGRDGITLHEKWSAGLRTFHGVMTAGFPNLLFTSAIASQATRSPNFMHTLVDNADHFGHIVERVLERGASTFEVTPEAEDQWVRLIVSGARDRREFLEACTPGRPNHDGHLDEARPGYVDFGGGVLEFLKLMADWRGAGNLSGLALA